MMAAAGAKVVVNDIGVSLTGEGGSATPAEQTKASSSSAAARRRSAPKSVAAWDTAQKIVQAALDTFGRIDVVVNNAGILRDVIFHKMTEDDWLSVIDVHLNGSFFVSRAAAEHFRKQESGAFVHMTSTSGLIGNFGQANYSAAKLGITALSKSIALDMQRYNVRSNCIAPFAWSRMTSSIPADTPEQKARVAKMQQMTPDKNAPMAVFLASDAAKDVTGQVFATPEERDHPVQLAPPDPHRASRRRLDPETDRRTRAPGAESRLHAAGPLRRSVHLGSGLTRLTSLPPARVARRRRGRGQRQPALLWCDRRRRIQ